MVLYTELLKLFGILLIASYNLNGSNGSPLSVEAEDEENSLKQALFLVELLKSDFGKSLRENGNKTNTDSENVEVENSTCPTPDDLNSTVAFNETGTTGSGAPGGGMSTPTPPANLGQAMQPGVLQMASWPPLPIPGYPPGLLQRGNLPDENNRFQYRYGRRRMMPDYYYYDSPMKSRGNFRRNNDPIGDLAHETATTQVQTTTNQSPTTTEVTTLLVEETNTSTSSISTVITQLSTSSLPSSQHTSEVTTLLVEETNTSTPSISTVITQSSTSSQPSSQPTPEVNSSTSSTSSLSIQITKSLPSSQPSSQTTPSNLRIIDNSNVPIISSSVLSTTKRTHLTIRPIKIYNKPAKTGIRRKPVSISKATPAILSNQFKKLKLNLNKRELETENNENQDVELAQAASALVTELEESTKDIPDLLRQIEDIQIVSTTKKKLTPTLKLFLKGSSRMPIPIPENNGFCHFHPQNPLCSSM